ncbi:MAG: hypothetical protein JWN48_5398 [Myxococcaceae bacterium]|nr:hypothetical protein [Myxococcaceae bacterium]
MTTNSLLRTLARARPLLLVLALASCASDGTDKDSDKSKDNGSAADGGRAADGGHAADSGHAGDAATSADAAQATDSGSAGDASRSEDGAVQVEPRASGVVPLGAAGNFVILAKSGISTVPSATVIGNLGVSPAAESYVTGFSLSADATNVFSTSPQVTGKVYAADHASPTPSNLTVAVHDMELASVDAAGRAPGVTELGAGNVGGKTLSPGVYKWSSGLLIPTDVTLSGPAGGVWIFQIAQDLTISSGAKTVLAGGALPENVFWQVSGQVELGTTAHLDGVVLAETAIMLRTGASVHGRLFSQTAVVLDASTVTQPAH